MATMTRPILITAGAGDAGMVLAPVEGRLPEVVWTGIVPEWAVRAGDASRNRFASELAALSPQQDRGSLLPEEASGFMTRPGLAGHRIVDSTAGVDAGRNWAPMFTTPELLTYETADGRGSGWRIGAVDATAELTLTTEIETLAGGNLRIRHTVTNIGSSSYLVEHLEVAVPVPSSARYLTDFTGRGCLEHMVQPRTIEQGLILREGREGKPGPDPAYVMMVSDTEMRFDTGTIIGVHVAWSGNGRYRCERHYSGRTTLGGGELLLPGEVVLRAGDRYSTPWLHLTCSDSGLDGVADRFHSFVRALPNHPRSDRPVNLNVWEAVYFDQSIERLTDLADSAARIGVERFVLDDGWFSTRRDDRSGLGDWWVSPEIFPEGLRPLANHVHSLGMQFGLWFEPESVNHDSQLYRDHPDWVLSTQGRDQAPWRWQLNLDLGRDEVVDHLFDQISTVLSENAVDYVKWDHNRFLDNAGTGRRGGAPGVHDQTIGFYSLIDRLRAAHPGIEWESCAGGGARTDLEVASRFERIWASDMTDAQARLEIQRWTAQLMPPETIGSHVSANRNHQTGRQIPLDFRCAVAFFGHFGIEWDITQCTNDESAELSRWIALYKSHRALLHSGRMVRVDTGSPELHLHGVVSADGREFIMQYARTDESLLPGPNLRVPRLPPEMSYDVRVIGGDIDPNRGRPWDTPRSRKDEYLISGSALAMVGLPTSISHPYEHFLVHGTARE